MKRCLFNSVIVVCAVFVSGALAQGVKLESSLTLDAGKKGTSGGETKKSEVNSQFSAAQEKLGALQASIGVAIDKMRLTAATAAEREKAVDAFIAQLKDAQMSMLETSELGKLIDQTIKNNEDKYDEYKKNTSDPNLRPEIRAVYEKLAKRFQDNVANFYDKKILLSKQMGSLKDHIEFFTQNKKVFGDLVLADETEAANQLLADVVDKAVALNGELDKTAREIGKTTLPSPESKGKDTTGVLHQ